MPLRNSSRSVRRIGPMRAIQSERLNTCSAAKAIVQLATEGRGLLANTLLDNYGVQHLPSVRIRISPTTTATPQSSSGVY